MKREIASWVIGATSAKDTQKIVTREYNRHTRRQLTEWKGDGQIVFLPRLTVDLDMIV